MTSDLRDSVRLRCSAGRAATVAYVIATPSNSLPTGPWPFWYSGSILIPTRAADSAHCRLRCSVGHTMVIAETMRRSISSRASRSANVVLPAPGVATARKSRGPGRLPSFPK